MTTITIHIKMPHYAKKCFLSIYGLSGRTSITSDEQLPAGLKITELRVLSR